MGEHEETHTVEETAGTDEPLREEDVTRADGLDDKVKEEELPGDA